MTNEEMIEKIKFVRSEVNAMADQHNEKRRKLVLIINHLLIYIDSEGRPERSDANLAEARRILSELGAEADMLGPAIKAQSPK